MSRQLTIGGVAPTTTAPSRARQKDDQAITSLRYWWGARQLLAERQVYDRAEHDRLEARLAPLAAWLADPANEGHPRYHEADGKRQELENWRLTYSQSWLRMIANRLEEMNEWAREIAQRLSDEGRDRCREIGWPDEVCRGTPF